MRPIKQIFVHCTGTRDNISVETIADGFKARGWRSPGYHIIINRFGRVFQLLDYNKVANGVRGYNKYSVHICYIGGVNNVGKYEDTRSDEQKKSLFNILKILHRRWPNAEILGHRDISIDTNNNGIVEPSEWVKQCPCFDVKKWLRIIGFYD